MMPVIGVAVRDSNRVVLSDSAVRAAEVLYIPGADLSETELALRDAECDVVTLHAGQLAVCHREPAVPAGLDALLSAASVIQAGSIAVRCGHRLTRPSLENACRNIDRLQQAFGRTRLFLEHAAETREAGSAEESDFLAHVLQQTGCGWLLDVTSIFAASRNASFDPYDFIAEVMPFASHVQMHLSGGEFDDRTTSYRDTHSQEVPDEVWSLFRHALVLGGHKTQAVFIERDRNFPSAESCLKEVRHAQFLTERVHGRQRMLHGRSVSRRA